MEILVYFILATIILFIIIPWTRPIGYILLVILILILGFEEGRTNR